jgi:zinc/manganese transport system substrate-binding protein
MGDVHAAGNPHLHLDPQNVSRVAAALATRIGELAPANAAYYAERERDFQRRWRDAVARWEREAAPLKGLPVVVYHRDLSYLFAWLGVRVVGSLEPKPGIPPSAAHLARLVDVLKQTPAQAVVRAAYNDPRAAEWLAREARIPAVVVPYTVGGTEAATNLFSLYDDTIARLLGALK